MHIFHKNFLHLIGLLHSPLVTVLLILFTPIRLLQLMPSHGLLILGPQGFLSHSIQKCASLILFQFCILLSICIEGHVPFLAVSTDTIIEQGWLSWPYALVMHYALFYALLGVIY